MTIGPIAAVTIATADLDASLELYQRLLEYRLTHQGTIAPALAQSWGTPTLAGRSWAVLAPRSAADFRLRFVQAPADAAYRPFRHLGWNAAEFLVRDVDALAQRLEGTAFRIIGPPADLSFSDQIRAMQVLGPSDEVLYLTQIKGPLTDFATPVAQAAVDRVFIVIAGGHSVESLQDYYARLDVPRAPIIDAVITVLSSAYDLPPRAPHQLSALPLAQACYIEADAMPAAVLPRTASAGELPPAIAMVSFRCDAFPDSLDYLGPPASSREEPYAGRRSVVCRGSAGELIELIENG